MTKIDIEDDGMVLITSHNAEQAEKAQTWIKNLTREIEVGEIFDGKVSQIMTDRMSGQEIGAIVELVPGKDGMIHISEFSNERIPNVSDVVKVGDPIKVKVVSVDKERGRIGLSVKALTETGERPPRPPRGLFSGGRGFGRGGGRDRFGPHRGGPSDRPHRPSW